MSDKAEMMNTKRWLAPIVFALVAVGLSAHVAGEQPSPPGQDRKESLVTLTKIAASYRVTLDAKRIVNLNERPAIRWGNPVSEVEDAALFVWTCEGQTGPGITHPSSFSPQPSEEEPFDLEGRAPARPSNRPDRGDDWEPPADESDEDVRRDGRQLLG